MVRGSVRRRHRCFVISQPVDVPGARRDRFLANTDGHRDQHHRPDSIRVRADCAGWHECVSCTRSQCGGTPTRALPTGPQARIQLYWADTNTSTQFAIDHYNIYRSTSSSFLPNVQITGASALAAGTGPAGVPASSPVGWQLSFIDRNVANGTTYYYRVSPATANDTETCQGKISPGVAERQGR